LRKQTPISVQRPLSRLRSMVVMGGLQLVRSAQTPLYNSDRVEFNYAPSDTVSVVSEAVFLTANHSTGTDKTKQHI